MKSKSVTEAAGNNKPWSNPNDMDEGSRDDSSIEDSNPVSPINTQQMQQESLINEGGPLPQTEGGQSLVPTSPPSPQQQTNILQNGLHNTYTSQPLAPPLASPYLHSSASSTSTSASTSPYSRPLDSDMLYLDMLLKKLKQGYDENSYLYLLEMYDKFLDHPTYKITISAQLKAYWEHFVNSMSKSLLQQLAHRIETRAHLKTRCLQLIQYKYTGENEKFYSMYSGVLYLAFAACDEEVGAFQSTLKFITEARNKFSEADFMASDLQTRAQSKLLEIQNKLILNDTNSGRFLESENQRLKEELASKEVEIQQLNKNNGLSKTKKRARDNEPSTTTTTTPSKSLKTTEKSSPHVSPNNLTDTMDFEVPSSPLDTPTNSHQSLESESQRLKEEVAFLQEKHSAQEVEIQQLNKKIEQTKEFAKALVKTIDVEASLSDEGSKAATCIQSQIRGYLTRELKIWEYIKTQVPVTLQNKIKDSNMFSYNVNADVFFKMGNFKKNIQKACNEKNLPDAIKVFADFEEKTENYYESLGLPK